VRSFALSAARHSWRSRIYPIALSMHVCVRFPFPHRLSLVTVDGAAADMPPQQGEKSMMRLRRFAIAVFAAATVVVGSLTTPSTASAMDCSSAQMLKSIYQMTGDALFYLGKFTNATYWYGRAAGIIDGGCG